MTAMPALSYQHTTTPAWPPASKNTVNKPLTANRSRRVVENDEYAAFAHRVVAAYARRVGTGDIEALTHLARLACDIEAATRTAVTELRDGHGYSWADIGRALGITRQAAQQRWSQP
ncbi:MAG TPA: hypothetical protein VKS82_14395 [Streptosporangiaceae bacterium]|nr:hypothetical protein [Streptosporangiaceae bacterium]